MKEAKRKSVGSNEFDSVDKTNVQVGGRVESCKCTGSRRRKVRGKGGEKRVKRSKGTAVEETEAAVRSKSKRCQ